MNDGARDSVGRGVGAMDMCIGKGLYSAIIFSLP